MNASSVRVLEPCYLSLSIYFIWTYHYQLQLWGIYNISGHIILPNYHLEELHTFN